MLIMNKQMMRTTITQLRQMALFAVGVSLLTACGGGQSGMKMGDDEFAVMTVTASNGFVRCRSIFIDCVWWQSEWKDGGR